MPGIGAILALTMMLETGTIGRFPTVGCFASSCRCVGSTRLSNGKQQGKGHTKNGNTDLAWACVEAAHFAIRFDPRSTRFQQRTQAKTNSLVAIKTMAPKLARACSCIMREHVLFEGARAFGS